MSADPIEQYLQANVPVRVLLEHGAERLDWLTELTASPIVISYRDSAGKIINEEVTKVELIERAHFLGWKPSEQDGQRDCIDFADTVLWEDAADQPGAVAGIWFAQEYATHWEVDAWGTPLGIPAERFATLEHRARAEREDAERVRAEVAQREELLSTANLCLGLIETRIRGRLKSDGVQLSYSQAWEETQAIARARGLDIFTDHQFPPHPWSGEEKQEVKRMVIFWDDLHHGRPASQCEPFEEGATA
ncbi:hypothetical protein [Xanthomonas arboricola]|uniref:hypothetical protein n=1 Tax=Xanthomonas arboricola TaxID=56448 RepID=UPI003EBA10CA